LGSVNLVGDGKRDPDPVVGGHLTLAAARRLTGALRHEIAMGRDPAADHQIQRRSIALSAENTFAAAARDFVDQHARKTRRWVEQAKLLGLNRELELVDRGLAARWRDKPITEIDPDAIFRLIEETKYKGVPGWARRTTEASEPRARAMFSTLSTMFNWLAAKRRVAVSPLASLKRPAAPRARDRVLSEREIVAFWKASEQARPPFDAVLKLLLLTGSRLNEVAGMQTGELSDDLEMWTIPGARTKNKRVHVVPLSSLAQAILKDVKRSSNCRFVFSTTGRTRVSGFSKLKNRLDVAMGLEVPWRLHDLRRTAATGMAELGVLTDVVELALNHISGARAGIVGVYNRAEKMAERQAALEKWADHVAGLVGRAKHGSMA
jgi:integrase